jgi:hypothetical protein
MTRAEQFVAEIDAFLERTGISATAFGKGAVNDPNLVRDLRAGRMPNLGLVERVYEFMQAQEASAA